MNARRWDAGGKYKEQEQKRACSDSGSDSGSGSDLGSNAGTSLGSIEDEDGGYTMLAGRTGLRRVSLRDIDCPWALGSGIPRLDR